MIRSRRSALVPAPLRAAALAAVAALAAALAPPALAQEDEDCLACHGEADIQATRDGKKVSVHVEAKTLAGSVHAKLTCVTCHEDLDGIERFPHGKVAPVDCGKCHDKEGESHAKSLHGQALARGDAMAPTCSDCHGFHDVVRAKDAAAPTNHMNIPLLCGKCHHEGSPVSRTHDIPQDRILENYSEGMHGEGLFKKGLAVTAVCTSCHTSHDILPHTDPRSSIAPGNLVNTCLQCHSRIEQVHRKVIEGELWEKEPNRIPVCVDCHQPHKVRRVYYPAGSANRDCLSGGCHGKPDLAVTRNGATVSLFVDEKAYVGSTHAEVGCAQCHSDVAPSHVRPCDAIKKKVDCAACHETQTRDYRESVHGTLHAKGDPDAPACLDCHSAHATQSRTSKDSPTFPRNVPQLCSKCHNDAVDAPARTQSGGRNPVSAFPESVHGRGLLESGLVVSATCVSCHTAHRTFPPTDPRSSVHRENVAATCGTCHEGIREIFETSVHAKADKDGERRPPTCYDCHTSHAIGRASGDFRANVVWECGGCHPEQSVTFFETFHGKATRLKGVVAAKCHDCHGTHGIQKVEDPASTVSGANRARTCSKCHEGAHDGFAEYRAHAHLNDPSEPLIYWTYRAMTGLLVGTMVFFVAHSALWFFRLVRTRSEWKPHRDRVRALVASGEARFYRRFDPAQSVTHVILVASFLTLALTGMALKFSGAPWGQRISDVLGGFQRMGMLHRTGAVLLIGLFTYHLLDLRRRKRETGTSWFELCLGRDSMMFGRRDLEEFLGTMRWFLGRGERPRYGRFTYWEKFDYFAVFWGVAVIGLSGLVLWFPEAFTRVLPGIAINVAAIVHGDEALLAVAFIFTIHFFNTQFRPDKFPIDVSIFTGRIPVEELKFERPREYEELVASGRLEERLCGPAPRHREHAFKVFGAIALTTGLLLVVGIVRALLMG